MRKFKGIEVDENKVRIEENLECFRCYDGSIHFACAKIEIFDKNNNQIYWENWIGYWQKWEYDKNNREISYENNAGEWEKRLLKDDKLASMIASIQEIVMLDSVKKKNIRLSNICHLKQKENKNENRNND